MSSQPSAEGWVVVQGAASGFAQDIVAGSHRLQSDEPVEGGGSGLGPTPYDFLLAALGSCTSMTVAMYARRKGWPLQHVVVRLRHSRTHAKDCTACEMQDARLDVINCEIEFTGPLTDDQRERLLWIASRCPVHRTLTSDIDIRTMLRPRDSHG